MSSSLIGLWIVATPLGNTGDLSPRAKEVLNGVDLVLAEDTRRAAKLLREAGVTPKKLTSFFEHNEDAKLPEILKILAEGFSAALVSDAGTPLLSDPGYNLVRECRRLGIKVSPVPGPSAPIAALSVAGLPPLPFSFLGFPPRGDKARADLFLAYANCPGSVVFFERKNRLRKTLEIALEIFGDRDAVICREITKVHEEFICGRLKELAGSPLDLMGEITVVIGKPESRVRTSEAEVLAIYNGLIADGLKPRDAARKTSALTDDWKSGEIYKLALGD